MENLWKDVSEAPPMAEPLLVKLADGRRVIGKFLLVGWVSAETTLPLRGVIGWMELPA